VLAVPGGRVLASTEPRHEGAYQVNATFFERGRGATFVQSVYVSPDTTEPMMTIAAPLRDRRGESRAVVCAHLSLATLEAIVGERAGIPADTYVVNRAGELVSGSDRTPAGPQRGLHSAGIDAALRGEKGRDAYLDHAGVPVFGSYRWLPQLELGLLVEIPQARAKRLTQRLVGALALAGLVAVVGLSVGIYSLGRRVVKPILDITETANRVAEGDLTAVAPVTTEDEVGALALTFNAMTAELRALYVGLQQSEARTRGIVDSALDAVVTFDVHGRITGWNPQAERLLGFSAEEARGRDVVESLVPERDRERHRRGLARFRETGAAPFVNRRFEMMGLDREGASFRWS
jgi:PAS domain S-box-containing protein